MAGSLAGKCTDACEIGRCSRIPASAISCGAVAHAVSSAAGKAGAAISVFCSEDRSPACAARHEADSLGHPRYGMEVQSNPPCLYERE